MLLIETKLIEDGFSICRSYPEKPGCKERCTDPAFYVDMIERRTPDARGHALCGYLRYANWRLTETSRAVDISAIRAASACPFRLSGQQLWRNMLLAENVCGARRLDDFAFWVISPRDNVELWRDNGINVEHEFRRVLTPFGNARFRRVTVEDVLEIMRTLIKGPNEAAWLDAFAEKYVLPPA